MKVPVIFRVDKQGEVTAVFPTLQGTSPKDFTVYAHVGQHGTGSKGWYHTTRAAKPEEYKDLLSELRVIYEDGPPDDDGSYVTLRVVSRFMQAHDELRGRRDSVVHISKNYTRG